MRSGGADLPAKALSIVQTCALVGSPLALSLSGKMPADAAFARQLKRKL